MNWSTLVLGDSLEVLIDNRGKNPEFSEHGVPAISGMYVGDGVLDLSSARRVSAEVWDKWMPNKTQKHDVVLTSEAPLGRVALVPSDEPLTLAQRVFGLRGRAGVLDSRFLFYAFQTTRVRADLQGRATGTTVLGIRQPALLKVQIPAPSFEEQQAIAEVLGALDDKIAANTKLAATLTGLLDAQFEQLGVNYEPEDDSQTVSLDELIELNPKVATPKEAEPVYVDMQKLPTAGMSISGWERRPAKGGARFMNDDTLLARITPCLENRKTGYVDFLPDGQAAIGSTEFIVMRSRPGIPKQLSYFLSTSERFRAYAIRHMVGSSGRQRVSALDLAGYTVSKPDPEALARFGDISTAHFKLLKSLTDENRTLAATRDALLPQLMSGKLRVKDAEKVLENAGV
ncbi:UNVERIFIED_ORG: type I restriction enzyme S subunit [Arthrobacter sp. UYEF13]